MGGCGSGRASSSRKRRTSDLLRLDVRQCQREGLLEAGSSFGLRWTQRDGTLASITVSAESGRLILATWHRPGEEGVTYPVSVEWTPCNYGGKRAWFRCPTKECQRRVAILYAGRFFACR